MAQMMGEILAGTRAIEHDLPLKSDEGRAISEKAVNHVVAVAAFCEPGAERRSR